MRRKKKKLALRSLPKITESASEPTLNNGLGCVEVGLGGDYLPSLDQNPNDGKQLLVEGGRSHESGSRSTLPHLPPPIYRDDKREEGDEERLKKKERERRERQRNRRMLPPPQRVLESEMVQGEEIELSGNNGGSGGVSDKGVFLRSDVLVGAKSLFGYQPRTKKDLVGVVGLDLVTGKESPKKQQDKDGYPVDRGSLQKLERKKKNDTLIDDIQDVDSQNSRVISPVKRNHSVKSEENKSSETNGSNPKAKLVHPESPVKNSRLWSSALTGDAYLKLVSYCVA